MKNYVQPGEAIPIIAPTGGTTAGVGVLIGSLFGIAANTVDAGKEVTISVEGVFDVAKTSALAIAVGDRLFWDPAGKVVNKTATAQQQVGIAVAAAANPSPTVRMLIEAALPVGS